MTLLMLSLAMMILVAMAFAFSKTAHPYFTAAKSAVTGLSALLLVNMVSGATGCYIAINTATVFVATVLSLPGVLALLVMKIIFHY
ncbi:MAG: pro-sigmaK processing inhibitor BofA family protein [Oscillospiraceae bacterium]|nr:pro-sigmaK processing inhibitor BofA family protein [Oscillospiraceae bacterium]